MRACLNLAAVLAALVASSASAAPQDAGPVVALTAGKLRGAQAQGVNAFRGVPYAQPPVGPLRWRPPQPPKPWPDVRQATGYGPDCVQNPFAGAVDGSNLPMSEDCLTLNLWAPAHARRAPVMVWIHGGGLSTGSASAPIFDGSAYARRGVVLVSVSYRLGRFGFFAHPALVKEHPDDLVGDYGLMDQLAALKWVQANIAAFGGDPGNVTIFGQSSGGSSVLHMMASPLARGVFQKAIVLSGGGRDRWARLDEAVGDRPSALKAGEAFTARMGVAGEPDALRWIPVDGVKGRVSLQVGEPDYSGPIVDGRLVPGDLDTLFAAGREAHVPMLIGSASDELGLAPKVLFEGLNRRLIAAAGKDAEAMERFYGAGHAEPADLVNDTSFVEPARALAALHAANGQPTWLYRFDYTPEAQRPQPGAYHASELSFVFGTIDRARFKPTDADWRTANAMMDYFTAFARTGAPAAAGQPAWKPYAQPGDPVMAFANDGPRLVPEPNRERLDFLAAHRDLK